MNEFILSMIAGGLVFIIGLYVGRHIGRNDGKLAVTSYVLTTSGVMNVIDEILRKHNLQDEVKDALAKAGFAVKKIRAEEP